MVIPHLHFFRERFVQNVHTGGSCVLRRSWVGFREQLKGASVVVVRFMSYVDGQ